MWSAMESLLKVVIEPGAGSEKGREGRRKKTKNVLERNLSSSSRYPSMPRYPPSPSHGEIDVAEIRKASFKVKIHASTRCHTFTHTSCSLLVCKFSLVKKVL